MKNPKSAFLLIFTIIPLMAQAHGEEVLYTLFIDFMSVLIFLICLKFLKLSVRQKGLLALWFFSAFILTFIFISLMPYNENQQFINSVSAFIPSAVAIGAYVVIDIKDREAE